MIEFKSIRHDELVIAHSLLVASILKLAIYCERNSDIELTPGKAFKRKFVNWAVDEFNWPRYTVDDLSVVNKVVNEMDFPPLSLIHQLLLDMKIGRHYKGKFKLTKSGKALMDEPSRLFSVVTPFFLFEYEHGVYRDRRDTLPVNWDVFLNVINIEATDPISGQSLTVKFFGQEDLAAPCAPRYRSSAFFVAVLRPLCWAGLLRETPIANSSFDTLFQKTLLWEAALTLETDRMLEC